jgi:hypothetical protein
MNLIPTSIYRVDTTAIAAMAAPVCDYQVITGMQPWLNFLPDQIMPKETAFALDRLCDRFAAWEALAAMNRLEANWDGYDADPIEAACIANTQLLLSALRANVPSPEITPNPNGTLTLDWQSVGQFLSVELGVTRFSSFWESRSGTRMAEGRLDANLPSFVARALDAMFPDLAQARPICEGFMIDAHRSSGFLAARCFG